VTKATVFEILPAIDLRGGAVVRLQQGDFGRETVFATDPIAIARQFAEEGARWIHVVDLDAARTGVPTHAGVVNAIAGAVGERTRVEAAGGLRTVEAVAAALDGGGARAVVGTAAIRDPGFARQIVHAHGAERIAVAIDIRGDRALGHAWSSSDPGVDAESAIHRLSDAGVETFEVTAIERDGLLSGPNLALYARLVRLVRGAIVASGGIATLDDITALREIGCAGAIIGRALYDGRFSVREAVERSGRGAQPGRSAATGR
jgi:phosphoribosylformimino-5-aminoimidazole carboxamide ribotide isomerase